MNFIFTFLIFLTFQVVAAATKPLEGFATNTTESFTENIPYHLSALALTPALVYSGADAKVHTAFSGNESDIFKPGDIAGYAAPFILTVPMYISGEVAKNERTIGASYALMQSTIITLSTVSLLKAFTGREPPEVDDSESVQRQSRDFNFGFLNRGIYDGWPSGHLATISSLASTLMHYYPAKPWIQYAGWGSMTYMLFAVSAHNQGQFHWFSDGVAGGLLGYSIGKTVGKNMRARVTGIKQEEKEDVSLYPILAPGSSGIRVVWIH